MVNVKKATFGIYRLPFGYYKTAGFYINQTGRDPFRVQVAFNYSQVGLSCTSWRNIQLVLETHKSAISFRPAPDRIFALD